MSGLRGIRRPIDREAAEALIQRAIDALDALDDDVDLEENGDAECEPDWGGGSHGS